MSRRLRRTVHLRDASGTLHVFGPHDELPTWAVERIRNPAAWADTAPTDSRPSAPATSVEPPAVEPAENTVPVPRRHGRGSGRAPWAEYAEHHQIVVTDAMSRDDIIDALAEAGVPTE